MLRGVASITDITAYSVGVSIQSLVGTIRRALEVDIRRPQIRPRSVRAGRCPEILNSIDKIETCYVFVGKIVTVFAYSETISLLMRL